MVSRPPERVAGRSGWYQHLVLMRRVLRAEPSLLAWTFQARESVNRGWAGSCFRLSTYCQAKLTAMKLALQVLLIGGTAKQSICLTVCYDSGLLK